MLNNLNYNISVIDNIWDEIKEKVSLQSEMEKHGITLVNAGMSKLKCVCPFHHDNDPSLYVYLDDEFETFYCFGCKISGSVIDFISNFKKIKISEALKYFKENYDLKYGTDLNLDDNIFGEIKIKKNKNLKKSFSVHLMYISNIIYREIRKSEDPKKVLMEYKPYLKQIDDCIKDEDYIYLRILEKYLFKKVKGTKIEKQ